MTSFGGVALTGNTIEEHVRTAVEAEKCGYDTAWMAEVFGPDAVTVLAASAVATSRIRLATGIVSTYVRSPYLAAMSFHSLADLADGRIAAGFGTSTPVIVEGWHGLPFPKPLRATREFVELFRKLMAGERVKADGVYKIRGVSLRGPAKGSPIPVYLGALNDRMLRLAAEIGDGVILNFPTIPYARHALEVINQSLAEAGRARTDIQIIANFRSGVGDFDTLAGVLRRELITYLLAPVYQRVFRSDGWADDVEAATTAWAAGDRVGAVANITDNFVAAHGLLGPKDEVLQRLGEFLALGIDQACLFPVVVDGEDVKGRQLEVVRALGPGG
jgi:probable F420-dependent oxidoreductase